MSERIAAKELPVSEILSEHYSFEMPSYQRPYSWTTEECGQLLEDLLDFYKNTEKLNQTPIENYFLGSIVLVKKEEDPRSLVVDGQQRLTTLTILISAIASLLQPEKTRHFEKYLKQEANDLIGYPESPRIKLRDKEQKFFEDYIVSHDLKGLEKDTSDNVSEGVVNLRNNALLTKKFLKEKFKNRAAIFEFSKFIMKNCYLVVVTTIDEDSAFRIFSVLNSRGLDLLPTDVLKAEIIGKVDKNKREKYTNIWEEKEIELSRERFAELFYYIRTAYLKNKMQKSLREEFNKIIEKEKSSEKLIDNVIVPYANAFKTIKGKNYRSEDNEETADNINSYLTWLDMINAYDWRVPALAYHVRHENEPENLLNFYKKLERLAAVHFIAGSTTQERIKRFAQIVTEIEESNPDLPSSLELDEDEKEMALKAISGNIYSELPHLRRKYLILRLDSFISDGIAKYKVPVISIEHVLPQTMNDDWKKLWTTEQHRKWLHKLANLALLSHRKNSKIQNSNFETKKEKCFTETDRTSFVLTQDAFNETEWTPDVLEKRQERFIKLFKEKWEL